MATSLKDRLARQAAGETRLGFDPTSRDETRLVPLPLRLIDPDPGQPRRDLGHLGDLALSIREHGLLCPIIVEPLDSGRYRILAGERRYTACKSLGWESAPCIVRTVAEQSRLALQLIENVHRKDLNPVEVAQAYQRLMTEFGLDQTALARRMGVSRSSINETLRILDLNPETLAAVRAAQPLSKSVLLEIAKEPDVRQQLALLEQARSGDGSVRQLRKAKRSEPVPKRTRCVAIMKFAEAVVTVKFRTGEATPDRVRSVLQRALDAGAEATTDGAVRTSEPTGQGSVVSRTGTD